MTLKPIFVKIGEIIGEIFININLLKINTLTETIFWLFW